MGIFKFVYAVVSGEDDYYAEQALASMHSLRLYNPGCHITFATDEETLGELRESHSPIMEYVTECVTINAPEGFTPLQRSRYVKTLIREQIEGDFLFLDCDTIITGDLMQLASFEGEVAATLFQHIPHWKKGTLPGRLKEFYENTKVKEKFDFSFFCNGGVILCKDTPLGHRLFKAWHEFWLESSTRYGYDYDQVNLWRANASLGNVLVELDGIYNCQVIYKKAALRYLGDCRVVHYQTTSSICGYVPFKDPVVLEGIRQNGITVDVEGMIWSLKRYLHYFLNLTALEGFELEVYNSPVVIVARNVSSTYDWTNKVIDFICRLFFRKTLGSA